MNTLIRIFAVLLQLAAINIATAASSSIADISSASTDGSASASVFSLAIDANVPPTGLTTSTDFKITLTLKPQPSDLNKSASLYTVLVANNQFFKLEANGSYASWNGAVETLTPFASAQLLTDSQTFTLLDGTMAAAGDYLYFAAYSIDGQTTLHFTPSPAQISVGTSAELPDATSSQAAKTFDQEIESDIVQSRCIACHIEGGLARTSGLLFQRTNTASSLNNFGALSAYIEKNGADKLLAKVAGEQGHVGGAQLAKESTGYASIEKVIAEINAGSSITSYAFSGSDGASTREASFLTSVVLEPRLATLRRAALLLQGRLPTDIEERAVVSDASLRSVLRSLMKGAAFREFVVTGVNDRLLIKGSDTIIQDTMKNFAKLHAIRVANFLDEDESTDSLSLYRLTQWPASRAGGELVAYVVENDKPYSEILTADYMMVNPDLNYLLEGTAQFDSSDGREVFKPARLKGYYFPSSLKETVRRVNSNSSYEIIGPPLEEFPHAGLLSDFGFLTRYPTTATNRNRARSRWTFYHFLGIDIEKSSQRPTDEASLTDRNNPTMNNPNCTVCHTLMDPVAGAFQNWDDFSLYRSNGRDGLDRLYKHPEDGSATLYRQGDLWYRDMRDPGLFDQKITEGETTLRELAKLIVAEPGFTTATARFWWPAFFGKPLLDKPAVEADQGYAAKFAAYQAQQSAINEFADVLAQRMDAKDMFVEMLMSPWFGAESTASLSFDAAQYEAQFGNRQLLTPEQLANKTRALTGVSWRSSLLVDGTTYSAYENLGVMLGGIDSDAVVTRATELTPTLTSVLMTHATETACPAVIRQFAKPKTERSLLSVVEESTLPLVFDSKEFTVPSEEKFDWKTVNLQSQLSAGSVSVSVAFLNPYCDYDGSQCVEQRNLYVDSLSITSPSGKLTRLNAADPRISLTGKHCYAETQGHVTFYSGCSLSLDLDLTESGLYTIESSISAQLAPIKGGYAEVRINIAQATDVLSATTPNAAAIRQQIVVLYDKLHGTEVKIDSDEVTQVYEIFAAALGVGATAHNGTFYNCNVGRDGLFDVEHYTKEQLASFRSVNPGQNWYQIDWSIKSPLQNTQFLVDSYRTKYAWTAVMMYMLSHYNYIHE